MRNSPVVLVWVQPPGIAKFECPDVTEKVIGFEYEDEETKADKLTLTIENSDLKNFDDPVFAMNNFIYVQWGYADALTLERKCIIKKVTGFKELKVEAYGLEVVLDHAEETRSYKPQSASATAEEIANRWGYSSWEVQHIADSKFIQPVVHQAMMTDAAVLRKLASDLSWQWYIDYDGFHFHPRDYYAKSFYLDILELKYSGDQTSTEILDIGLEMDVTRIPQTQQIFVADQKRRYALNIKSDAMSDPDRQWINEMQIATNTFEPASGYNGDERGPKSAVRLKTRSAAEGKSWAEALYNLKQLDAVKMKVKTIGDPNIYAKSVVFVDNIGARLSQSYFVTGVKHVIRGGYTCELSLVGDGIGGRKTTSMYASEADAIQVGTAAAGSHYRRRDGRGGATPSGNQLKAPGQNLETPQQLKELQAREKLLPEEAKVDQGKLDEVVAGFLPTPEDPYRNAKVYGNTILNRRPIVKLPYGDIATTYSHTVPVGKYWMNVPGITHDGQILETDDDAYEYYKRTTEHLGVFTTYDAALKSAEAVHLNQEKYPPVNELPAIKDYSVPALIAPPPVPDRDPFSHESLSGDSPTTASDLAPPNAYQRDPFGAEPELREERLGMLTPMIVETPEGPKTVLVDAGTDASKNQDPEIIPGEIVYDFHNEEAETVVATPMYTEKERASALKAVYTQNKGINTGGSGYNYDYTAVPYAEVSGEQVPVRPIVVRTSPNAPYWTVLPGISRDGTLLTEDQANRYYRDTGEFLAVQPTQEKAQKAADAIADFLVKYPPKSSNDAGQKVNIPQRKAAIQ